MKIIESFTEFQPLEEVWIGGAYPEKFYRNKPQEVYERFAYITEQTIKGFNNLENKLTELGVRVQKPKFTEHLIDYQDTMGNLIKPPVCPRHWAITVGNELWINPQGYQEEPYQHAIDEYRMVYWSQTGRSRMVFIRPWFAAPSSINTREGI